MATTPRQPPPPQTRETSACRGLCCPSSAPSRSVRIRSIQPQNTMRPVTTTTGSALPAFADTLRQHSLPALTREAVTTLQINVGRLCNLACHHCHVEAGPLRTEVMPERVVDRLIALLDLNPTIAVPEHARGAVPRGARTPVRHRVSPAAHDHEHADQAFRDAARADPTNRRVYELARQSLQSSHGGRRDVSIACQRGMGRTAL